MAIIPLSDWPAQAGALLRALDTLLLSSLAQRNLGAAAEFAIVLFLSALLILAWWQRRQAIVRFGALVLLFNVAYVFLSLRAQGAPTRYLYPSMIGAWLILLALSSDRRLRSLRFPITLSLVALAGFGAGSSSTLLRTYFAEQEWRRDNIQNVMREVEGRGFKFCWGDYWTSYILGYLAQGSTIYSPHPFSEDSQIRVPGYAKQVSAANPACFIFRDPGSPLGALHFSEKNPWVK
ncbi:MAG: hypothetical protein EOP11_22445 [Proteobacteria bacterium]|nr:MAG: hypothetical protein EOP11_22445 [Pseudomonadota bacterium]